MRTKDETLEELERLKKEKWEILPLRAKAYQKVKEVQREFNKIRKKELDIERYILDIIEKIK